MFSGGIERRTLARLDDAAAGRRRHGAPSATRSPFWQRWFDDAIGNDAFWEPLDHTPPPRRRAPRPTTSCPAGTISCSTSCCATTRRSSTPASTPYLTVGPWTHVTDGTSATSMRETLTWMRAKLLGDRSGLRDKPVAHPHFAAATNGASSTPIRPAPPDTQIWHLHPGNVLSQRPVTASRARPLHLRSGRPDAQSSAAPCSPSPAPARSTRRRSKRATTC